jgi:glucose dehydrogenase
MKSNKLEPVKHIGMGRIIFVFSLLLLWMAPANIQAEEADWKYPGFDQYSNSFSHKQSQITPKNVKNLEIKWVWEMPRRTPAVRDADGSLVQGSWTAPLVIDGVVYTASMDNQIFALDAQNGSLICSNSVPLERISGRVRYATRGITYHNDSIVMTAADCSVYAFDKEDCGIRWTMPSTCRDIPGNEGFYYGMNPPLIFEDYLFVSSSGAETGVRGYIAAYNLTTKELIWRWFSVPPSVEGPKNWGEEFYKGNIPFFENDWGTSKEIAGGHIWAWPALDTEKKIIFVGTGNPAPDVNASTRPGPNLYTNSVVALNVTDGEMLWYYQLTSHGMYDHDIAASVIFDEIGSRKKKVVIAGSKSGFVLVLDAETGRPLYPAVPVSLQLNNFNDNNPTADLMAKSPEDKIICPADNGGVQSSPALSDGIIYAVGQDQCRRMVAGGITTRDKYFAGRSIEVGMEDNSTLYAIDASTGEKLWSFFMNSTYRKGAVTLSNNLVILGADNGQVYFLDKGGDLLKELEINNPVAAPITMGSDKKDEMKIFVPFGGRGYRDDKIGMLALGLKEKNKLDNLGIYLLPMTLILLLLWLLIRLAVKK